MGARTLAAVLLLAAATASTGALANQNQERRERDEQRNDRGGLEDTKTVRAISFANDKGQILITAVIVIANTDVVLGARTDVGVRQVDEDRLDLSGVPLLGALFGGDDDDDDDEDGPSSPVRIGTAYLISNTLAVDLRENLPTAAGGASQAPADADDLATAGTAIETHIRTVSNGITVEFGLPHDFGGNQLKLETFRLLNRNYSYNMPGTDFMVVGRMAEAPVESDDSGDRIPVIGDIPLLRGLFSQPAGGAYLEKRNLVVLIKPSILEDDYE